MTRGASSRRPRWSSAPGLRVGCRRPGARDGLARRAGGSRGLRRVPAGAPGYGPSRLLPDGGYVSMRSSWTREADQIVLDVGPLGCPYSSGHGHADLLSVQCTFGGRPYIVDPGTFQYTADGGAGPTSARPRPTAPWRWTAPARPPRRALLVEQPSQRPLGDLAPGDVLDVAEGEHRGLRAAPGRGGSPAPGHPGEGRILCRRGRPDRLGRAPSRRALPVRSHAPHPERRRLGDRR